MNVYEKIKILEPSFTSSEKKVADFLCFNKKDTPFLTIYNVAKSTGVSTATVTRFAKKMGCRNFSELKIFFAKQSSGSLHEIFSAIEPKDTDEEIVKKVFHGNKKSLEDTLHITDISKLTALARKIVTAKRLICIGIGGSGNVAQDAALRFSHLDLQSEAYTDYYHILIQMLRADVNTVVIGISHSGRSTITVEGLKMAREQNATTVGISNYYNSPLARVSDYFFCTSFPETGVKVAALSSRIAQLCLIDAIYLLVAKYKKKLWDVSKLNDLTNKLLRKK